MNKSDISGTTDSIEYAGNMLDWHDQFDSSTRSLLEITGINQHRMATASGLNDYDYQNLSSLSLGLKNLNQLETVNKVSIPPEVMEHFKDIKCHCMMGLFPEIGRAWLTIDSDIYIWTYEHSRDVAYFDGLNHLIVSVGLVKPKPGVFVADVKYLLIITTPKEIIGLGVTFGDSKKSISSPSSSPLNSSNYEEMQLMNKPIFIINTEDIAITTITGTEDSRIFLGGRDGCLYEIYYQAESNWFGKRYKKINHSQGLMSYMIPGFLKVFSEIDSIIKIVVDNSRNLLYTLTEKGSIEAWELGVDKTATRRIARISKNDIALQASTVIKTVDSSVFKPVVTLCPLTHDDSPNLHLIAITHCGARLYFATTQLFVVQQSNIVLQPDPIKPQNLYLLHVRLPPGYTPNTTVGKPKLVHTAFYNQGTLLMVSTPQKDQDLLWSLSSEPFSFHPYLAESTTVIPLNAQVWGIAAVVEKQSKGTLVSSLKNAQVNKKVVLLTNQGAHIIALLKPVDLLQQLLMACHGPHHEAVKAYFQIQSEPQACASSLLIACRESFKGTELGLWAKKAFLLYGGEPHYGTNYQINQPASGTQNLNASAFNGNSISTFIKSKTPFTAFRPASSVQQSLLQQTKHPLSPISKQSFGVQQTEPNIFYSYKHAGLFLHMCRLLRPIWKKKCIFQQAYSSISNIDCSYLLHDLYAIKSIIESYPMNNVSRYLQDYGNQNTSIGSVSNSYGPFLQNNVNNQQRNSLEHAYADENKSINALSLFIKHTCEVIALWKILCEHQFHIIMLTLPKEEQLVLSSCTFRDLILARSDTCALLICSLINIYLNDNASVRSISAKLRDVCPNLYCHEDAVIHKATEILRVSRNCNDSEEQKEYLYMALQLCKDAAPNLPLSNICQQFTVANFHQGVIQLCATCAAKIDPNGAGLHFYKNNEPIEDQEGYLAFSARINIYKEIKLMLDQIYENYCNANSILDNTKLGYVENNETNVNENILRIVALTLQTTDKLLHTSVYEWLLSHNLLSELLHISEPSLGEFLAHSFNRHPENLQLADILWKYHERNGQHAAATKTLDDLATMPNSTISLTQRIEYLARAVMCMRSDTVGYSVNGILLKDLEDKLEIARVQKLLLDDLSSQIDLDAREAIQSLNSTLYNITQLYADFAEPFDLWDCKLTILNCSHHNNSLLIESVWTQILNKEMSIHGSPYEKSNRILSKVQTLAKEYDSSGHCFPIEFLVRELELRCCELKLKESPVPDALIAMNLDIDMLLDIYNRMITMSERVWASEGNEWHLVQSTTRIVSILAAQPNLIATRNRRRVVSKAQDLISDCRNLLYPKPDTKHLVDALLEIEARLQIILC